MDANNNFQPYTFYHSNMPSSWYTISDRQLIWTKHLNQTSILHVISHVTTNIRFPTVGQFKPSILHSCQYIKAQRFRGRDRDLLGSRDVINHVTTGMYGFFSVVSLNDYLSLMVSNTEP